MPNDRPRRATRDRRVVDDAPLPAEPSEAAKQADSTRKAEEAASHAEASSRDEPKRKAEQQAPPPLTNHAAAGASSEVKAKPTSPSVKQEPSTPFKQEMPPPPPPNSQARPEKDEKAQAKQMLALLERAQEKPERDRLIEAAKRGLPSSRGGESLRDACEFVLMLPLGAGIMRCGWNLASCKKRFYRIAQLIHPDKVCSFSQLAARLPEFEEAMKDINAAWDELSRLLQKDEGTYTPGPQSAEASPRSTPSPNQRRRPRGRQRTPRSPPPPPPMPLQPWEQFLRADPDPGDGVSELLACVLSLTVAARQGPKASAANSDAVMHAVMHVVM